MTPAHASFSQQQDGHISLREITFDTVREACRLSDSLPEAQRRMVAPNAVSIAQAYFCEHAWFRAIYADETMVGFVMLYIDESIGAYDLWRLMIAHPYQGMGYGRRAMERVIDEVRRRPRAKRLMVSYVPVAGGPETFYRKLGFRPTGEVHDGEVVAQLEL